MCTLSCCSKCCGLFSIFAIFFLVCIASMFDSQPLFTDLEIYEEGESEEASNNCYIAAVIYAVTLACCGLFSIFAIFFLVCIASMFDSQPLFTDIEIYEDGESDEASRNCYIAAVIYAVTLGLSLVCAVVDRATRGKRPAIADTTAEPTADIGLSQMGGSVKNSA